MWSKFTLGKMNVTMLHVTLLSWRTYSPIVHSVFSTRESALVPVAAAAVSVHLDITRASQSSSLKDETKHRLVQHVCVLHYVPP